MVELSDLVSNMVAVPIIATSEFGQKFNQFLGIKKRIEDVMEPREYTGGEFCPTFKEKQDGKTVYIIAPYSSQITPQDWVTRVGLVSNAAKLAGSKRNILLAPDLPYARQDRDPNNDEKMSGQPFSIQYLARNFQAAEIDHVMTMHLHSERIRDIFNDVYQKTDHQVITNVDPAPIIAHYFLNQSMITDVSGSNIVFVAPDKGAMGFVKRVREMMFMEDSSYVYCKKNRIEPNNPDAVKIEVDKASDNFNGFNGKTLILLDDIGDTCGTMASAYRDLMQHSSHGKPERMLLYFTHPVLAGTSHTEAQQRLHRLDAQEIIMTNSRPFIEDHRTSDFKLNSSVLRCAGYFASVAINCLEQDRLYSEVFSTQTRGDLAKFSDLYDIKRSTLHISSPPMRTVQLL